jgi:hypothetical protein
MNIWVKLPGCKPELIDSCTRKETAFMLINYAVCYQHTPDAVLWAGTRNDCPVPVNDVVKRGKTVLKLVGSHYKYVEV